MSITKDDLNKLIQQLPENVLPLAADFLGKLVVNPNVHNIPWDDEPTTQQDIEDIMKAKESFSRGESIKLKDVIDELLN